VSAIAPASVTDRTYKFSSIAPASFLDRTYKVFTDRTCKLHRL
jgi:hypothetical protein